MAPTIRYSKQRESILKLLSGTKSHPTAEWLYHNLKTENEQISLATVYRNLRQLVQLGEIQCFETRDRIEHYDACIDLHYHLVCDNCNRIIDLELSPLKTLDEEVKKMCGHDIKEHSLIFYGECCDCINQK